MTPEQIDLFNGGWGDAPEKPAAPVAPAAPEPAAVIPPDAPPNSVEVPEKKAKRTRAAAPAATLRDQYAQAALTGLLAAGLPYTEAPAIALKTADLMLAARDQE